MEQKHDVIYQIRQANGLVRHGAPNFVDYTLAFALWKGLGGHDSPYNLCAKHGNIISIQQRGSQSKMGVNSTFFLSEDDDGNESLYSLEKEYFELIDRYKDLRKETEELKSQLSSIEPVQDIRGLIPAAPKKISGVRYMLDWGENQEEFEDFGKAAKNFNALVKFGVKVALYERTTLDLVVSGNPEDYQIRRDADDVLMVSSKSLEEVESLCEEGYTIWRNIRLRNVGKK